MINKYTTIIKGKLTQISWLDVVGISIFFIILSIAFFFFLRKTEYITIRIRVTEADSLYTWNRPPAWFVEHLTEGKEEKDGFGRVTLRIQKVTRYVSNDEIQGANVDMRVRAVYNSRTKQYYYNGTPLLVGKYQVFNVQDMQIPGVIHYVSAQDIPEIKKQYIVEGYLDPRNNDVRLENPNDVLSTNKYVYDGVPKFISQQLSEGLMMKDTSGNAIATISSLSRGQAYLHDIENGQEYKIPVILPCAYRGYYLITFRTSKGRDQ
jgi:hypothetical protein